VHRLRPVQVDRGGDTAEREGPDPVGRLRPNRAAVTASAVMIQSIGFSPAAVTRTRISPGPACGAGSSRMFRTSGPPNESSRTTLLVLADI